MNTLPRFVVSLCLLGLASAANAIPIYELPYSILGPNSDIEKNGTGGGGGNANANNQTSNFYRLENVVTQFNSLLSDPSDRLPTPILDGAINLGSNVVSAGGLTGFDYAVLHYGKGPGGIGSGGGVALYYLNSASEYIFPAIGTGPNGLGGFSSLTLFKGDDIPKSVPDGGSSVMLFGAPLALIAMLRRKFAL
jgi:hypothetical protein